MAKKPSFTKSKIVAVSKKPSNFSTLISDRLHELHVTNNILSHRISRGSFRAFEIAGDNPTPVSTPPEAQPVVDQLKSELQGVVDQAKQDAGSAAQALSASKDNGAFDAQMAASKAKAEADAKTLVDDAYVQLTKIGDANPALQNAIASLTTALESVITTVLNSLIQAFVTVLNEVASLLQQGVQTLLDFITTKFSSIFSWIGKALPQTAAA